MFNKYKITNKIESIAPLQIQEEWDCSGWIVDNSSIQQINKIMLCLTVTDKIVEQARKNNCDMIISHHPCFYIPLNWSNINIYCAHTNLDKANGGTTDTLIETLNNNGLPAWNSLEIPQIYSEESAVKFLRIINFKEKITVKNFSKIIKKVSKNARLINNFDKKYIKTVAFCAGSGSEFIKISAKLGVDCFVTGDLKFHIALESPIVVYDIGHFESEIIVLPLFEDILKDFNVSIIYSNESSPFIQL